ncbi:hypothetical protein BJX99DRAFT_255388 [Aspergillus californicus]
MVALLSLLLWALTSVSAQHISSEDIHPHSSTRDPDFILRMPVPTTNIPVNNFIVQWVYNPELYDGPFTVELAHLSYVSPGTTGPMTMTTATTTVNLEDGYTTLPMSFLPSMGRHDTSPFSFFMGTTDSLGTRWGYFRDELTLKGPVAYDYMTPVPNLIELPTEPRYETTAISTGEATTTTMSGTTTTMTTEAETTEPDTTIPTPTGPVEADDHKDWSEVEDTGLSTGAKAGIGAGVSAGVLLLVAAGGFLLYRRKNANGPVKEILEISPGTTY